MRNQMVVVLSALAALSPALLGQAGKVNRGRELVEVVAKCQECHTARLANGELDRNAWLKGGRDNAPDLTSSGSLVKRWNERGLLRFLMTAEDPDGKTVPVHMPPYRLRRDDAEAVAAYLMSLR